MSREHPVLGLVHILTTTAPDVLQMISDAWNEAGPEERYWMSQYMVLCAALDESLITDARFL